MFSRILSLACAVLISLTSTPACGLVRAGVEDNGENSLISLISTPDCGLVRAGVEDKGDISLISVPVEPFNSDYREFLFSEMFYNYSDFDWYTDDFINNKRELFVWGKNGNYSGVVSLVSDYIFGYNLAVPEDGVYDGILPIGQSGSDWLELLQSKLSDFFGSYFDTFDIGLGFYDDFANDNFNPIKDTLLVFDHGVLALEDLNISFGDSGFLAFCLYDPDLIPPELLNNLSVSDSGLITWSGGFPPYTVEINGSSYSTSQTQYQIDLSSDPVQDYFIQVVDSDSILNCEWQYVYTNGIINNLYNLIYGTLFKGELPSILTNVSEEVSALLTLLCILILLAGPCLIVFGFIKFIWYFVDR